MRSFCKTVIFVLSVTLVLIFAGCSKKNQTGTMNALTYPSSASANPDGKFYVTTVTPDGELSSTVKYPSIQVAFSEPVVALQKLGTPSDKSDVITITPPLNGVFRWYGTSILSFESKEAVIPQKEYKITINSSTKSVHGNQITGDLEFIFHPEELKMVALVPGYGDIKEGNYIDEDSVPLKAAQDILVTFNFPVKSSVVTQFLSVQAEGRTLPYTAAQEQENAIRLSLSAQPPENVDIFLELKEGAMADNDCYKKTQSQSLSFHTLKPFEITNFDSTPYLSSFYSKPVTVTFSSFLAAGSEDKLAKNISVALDKSSSTFSPVTKENLEISGRMLIIHSLPISYGQTYSIMLGGDIEDLYGRKLGTRATYDVEVGEARSYVYFKDSGLKILEAQFDPKLVFKHQNIKSGSSYTVSKILDNKGSKVSADSTETVLDPSVIPQNRSIIECIDLKPYLEKSGDQYHGTARLNSNIKYEETYTDWRTDQKVSKIYTNNNEQTIQVTDLGVTARYGYNKAAVLVTKLSTGNPVSGAKVNLYIDHKPYDHKDHSKEILSLNGLKSVGNGVTDSEGFVIFDCKIPDSASYGVYYYIEAQTSDDHVLYSADSHNMWRSGVDNVSSISSATRKKGVTFMFTDRGLYKPGETVSFRGFDKNLCMGEYSQYKGKYKIQLTDSGWNPEVYYTEEGTTSDNGTFWGRFKIPETLDVGYYNLTYTRDLDGNTYTSSCPIQIQYFERLRFEVASSVPDITYYSGDNIAIDLKANYLGGGSLAGSTFETMWSRQKSYFAPVSEDYKSFSYGPEQGYDWGDVLETENGALSSDGTGSTSQKTGGEKIIGSPYLYKAQVSVTDSGNQQISTTSSVTVHPARYYIGLKRTGNVYFPKKGDAVNFDYICLTPEETAPLASDLPSNKSVKMELLREDWKEVQQVSWNGSINTRYQKEIIKESENSIKLSGTATPTSISVTPEKGGSYILRLSSTDSKGHDVVTESSFYVTSYDGAWNYRDDDEEITLQANKASYEPGDTAQILMKSPLPKGKYILTVEREGLIKQELLTIDAPTTVLTLPVEESYTPVVYVTLSSYTVRNSAPKNDFNTPDVDKPKGLFGATEIVISPVLKMFDVDVIADKGSYLPGETATIKLHATKNGKPLSNAEITLMAVDRGVIDLINYHVADPVEYFYSRYLFPDCVKGGDSRAMLIDPVTYEIKNLIGGDSDKLNERKNFDPTAVFEPAIITDKNGDAVCTFTLPDSLTAYRITAVGISDNNFAITESEMNVANPVSVRAALPRQLRLNDEGECGVVISNLENSAKDVSISLNVYEGIDMIENYVADGEAKIAGSAVVTGEKQKNIKVPANTTQPLMFNVNAKKEGFVTLEFVVRSDVVNEKILLPLEIEKPYITETVTTVGSVSGDGKNATGKELISLPAGEDEDKTELYVQLDPTRLGVLGEAIRYVFRYPYGCMEQKSSRMLPLAAFGKYIKVFGLDSEVKNPASVVKREIKSWGSYQNYDGGFSYWPGRGYSDPLVSARVAEVLALAEENGVDISGVDTQSLGAYLVSKANSAISSSASEYQCYRAAHMYYSASLLGQKISKSNLETIVANCKSDPETLALVGLTYLPSNDSKAKEVSRTLRSLIMLTSQGAVFSNSFSTKGYWTFFTDKSESYALALQLFTALNPSDEINTHLLHELLELQKASKGYWVSTAATGRVLIAIREFIQRNNLENLDFTAEALLNSKKILDGSFKGVAALAVDKTLTGNDLSGIPRDKELPLEFNKKGTGTLYYTVSLKYPLPVTEQFARDEGICIFTEIYDIKTGELVSDDKLEYGKTYRQKVYISSTRDRKFVAARVPIPAGCEILNAAFVTTALYPEESKKTIDDWDYYEDYNWGLSNESILNSEVQYFWNYFPAGYQQVDYLFRAARKGKYNTPSSTAECMYESEIFGRSSGKVWSIE